MVLDFQVYDQFFGFGGLFSISRDDLDLRLVMFCMIFYTELRLLAAHLQLSYLIGISTG